jgi:heptosyltransferase-2
MTLPALQALREQWPNAHIELVGYPHIAELAQTGKTIDASRSLDEAGMARLFSKRPDFEDHQLSYLRSFDMVFSYLHDPGNTVVRNIEKIGVKKVIQGSPLVTDCHAVDHLLKPLQELEIFRENARPSIEIEDEKLRLEGRNWLNSQHLHAPVLAIHPGSGSTSKNWPPARFIDLYHRIQERGWNAFFILGEADRQVADVIFEQLPDAPILSECRLSKVAAVLSACNSYLGNDSGITHLAAALDIPVVSLFGPTSPEYWGPRGPHVTILQAEDRQLQRLSVTRVLRALLP